MRQKQRSKRKKDYDKRLEKMMEHDERLRGKDQAKTKDAAEDSKKITSSWRSQRTQQDLEDEKRRKMEKRCLES